GALGTDCPLARPALGDATLGAAADAGAPSPDVALRSVVGGVQPSRAKPSTNGCRELASRRFIGRNTAARSDTNAGHEFAPKAPSPRERVAERPWAPPTPAHVWRRKARERWEETACCR